MVKPQPRRGSNAVQRAALVQRLPDQISSKTPHMPAKNPYQWADFVAGLELADFVVGLELAGFVVGAVFSLPSVSSLIT